MELKSLNFVQCPIQTLHQYWHRIINLHQNWCTIKVESSTYHPMYLLVYLCTVGTHLRLLKMLNLRQYVVIGIRMYFSAYLHIVVTSLRLLKMLNLRQYWR